MTAEHQRYIGVARPVQGVDPHPPRLVVDLVKPRAAAEHAAAAAPASEQAAAAPAALAALPDPPIRPVQSFPPVPPVPSAPVERSPHPEAPDGATVQHHPAPVAGEPEVGGVAIGRVTMGRPPRYGRTSGHRKRFRRAVFRRFELVVWVAAVAVAATMIVLLVRGPEQQVALAGPSVGGSDGPAPSSPSAPMSSTGQCVFDPCPTTRYSGVPTRVRIPSITVDSPLEDLVLDAQHQLEPPTDYAQAGWWSGGVVPGDNGAAVIAGHVDNYRGPAVFYELHALKPGDRVEVDRGGQTVTFRVTTVEQYPKDAFPTDRVYSPTPGPELRLITCGGSFDTTKRSYRDNIVVYAILA